MVSVSGPARDVISAEEIASKFSGGRSVSEVLEATERDFAIKWREPATEEVEAWAGAILEKIADPGSRRSPVLNKKAFDGGWRENYLLAEKQGLSHHSLKPRYYRPSKFLRYAGRLAVVDDVDAEWQIFTLIRRVIYRAFLRRFTEVHEFGCGSCSNLLLFAEMARNQRIRGYDFVASSVEIGRLLQADTTQDVSVELFDMSDPTSNPKIGDGSAVCTIHAMEQLGTSFEPMLQYLLHSGAELVVQLEPILDFYDLATLYDFLSAQYCVRRGYLSGYLGRLRELESSGELEVIECRRTAIGGPVHEASSLIVWRPCPKTRRPS
jgi:hypothetical protein